MAGDQSHDAAQHQSFVDLLYEHAAKFAERKAIVDFDNERFITYTELKQQVDAVASALAKRGFGRGQYLSMYSSNCIENAPIAHGTMATGGTLHLVKPGTSHEELSVHLSMVRPRFIVTSSDLASFVKRVIEGTDCAVEEIFVIGDFLDGQGSAKELLDDDGTENPIGKVTIDTENDVALMLATGGTSGIAKTVMGTHRSLMVGLTINEPQKIPTEEFVLSFQPFNYISGILSSYSHMLCSGFTVVSMKEFNPEMVLKALEKYRVKLIFLAPATMAALIQSEYFPQTDLSQLKCLIHAGAPIGESVVEEIMEKFEEKSPGMMFVQAYGMTEIFGGAISTGFTTIKQSIKKGSTGKVLPYAEVKIRSLTTEGSFCEAGQPGELIIKCPMLMKGYFKNEDATNKAIKDGWFYTGDYAWFDEDGYYYVVDRIEQLLHTKEGIIVPSELESVIKIHPKVCDCVVVGKKEDDWDRPVAFLVTNCTVTEDDIKAYVADKVPPYQQLESVRFVDEIPRSPAGKLLRKNMKV